MALHPFSGNAYKHKRKREKKILALHEGASKMFCRSCMQLQVKPFFELKNVFNKIYFMFLQKKYFGSSAF